MSFEHLNLLAQISKPSTGYLDFAQEWGAKRESLNVNLADLPKLVTEFKQRSKTPYEANPEITLYDAAPAVRLANACESVSNLVYSIAEIAARFANKVSRKFPASFNQIRKKVRDGKFDQAVTQAMGDLQWYERVREIRTEWAHYSSPFVGLDGDEPSIVLRSFRSKDDRVHFTGHVSFKVDELRQWATSAFHTIDGLASHLVRDHLIHSFDMEQVIGQPVRDRQGFPIIKDGRFQTEELTVADYMFRYGILEKCATIERWSKELRVPVDVLRGALKDVTPLDGQQPDGTSVEYYRERAVRQACKHLMKIVVNVQPPESKLPDEEVKSEDAPLKPHETT